MQVKTIQTHLGKYGLKKVGDVYETSDLHAAELKGKGLVEADVEAVKEKEGQKILVSDKTESLVTTTALKGDNDGPMVKATKEELKPKKNGKG